MESINAARRTEDIALDLLKFVASQANVGTKGPGPPASASPPQPSLRARHATARALRPLPPGSRGPGRNPDRKEVVPPPHPLRVAVIGAGAFGRNHLRVYRELEQAGHPVQLAAVVDSNPAAPRSRRKFGVPGFATIEACLAARPLDAASVCVPTIHHASAAEPLLAAGIDLLIEKPLAATLAEADRILDLAARTTASCRSATSSASTPPSPPPPASHRPMFFEAHRLSIFTPRSLDVDVVLDLMIHDLDIVLTLVASPVREVRAVGLPVLSKKVDIANVRLEFETGCVANFTASRVSTERVRKLRFFQPHSTSRSTSPARIC